MYQQHIGIGSSEIDYENKYRGNERRPKKGSIMRYKKNLGYVRENVINGLVKWRFKIASGCLKMLGESKG